MKTALATCNNCDRTYEALVIDRPFYCEWCRNTAVRLLAVMACPTDPTRNYMKQGTA